MKRVVVIIMSFFLSCFAQDERHEIVQKRKHKVVVPIMQPTGREYYESLVERASQRHWAFVNTFQYQSDRGGYDCTGCSGPLSAVALGCDPITIKDIYLFAKLSDDNKVRINNCDPLAPERGGVPVGGVGVPFGGFRDDLYTTLLAPVELDFDARQSEASFITSGMYRHDIGSSNRFSIAFGYQIPFKSKKHSLDFTFKNGELFRPGFIPDTTQRENSLKQFYRDYSSLEDFIIRCVFDSKCLNYQGTQTKSGLGDISLFALFEYHEDWSFELGLQCVLPTASKGSGNYLWEPILGNGGAFQFDPFAQLLFATSVPYLNPFARLAAEISASHQTDTMRVPTLITNDKRQMVHNVSGLSSPPSFENFYVDPFEEFDTQCPMFAGKTPCIDRKIGSKILFGIGNYAYKLFSIDFRWGLFYDYYHKSKDSFNNDGLNCDCDETVVIDSCAMERCTDETAHLLGTNLTYKFSNLFELTAGGQYTVMGKNVPKRGSCYLSFVAVF